MHMAAEGDHQRKTTEGLVASERWGIKRKAGLLPPEEFMDDDDDEPPEDYGVIAEEDGEAILQFEAAFDQQNATESLPPDLYPNGRNTSFKKAGTRSSWLKRLHLAARDITLTEATADDINAFTTERVKSGQWAPRTARSYAETLKKFYRFHQDHPIEPAEINQHEASSAGWDHRDMLDHEERHALAAEAPDNARDAAIVNLLLYTGMRNTALRMCRVKDIDLEAGEYYFNNEADGLKDIHKPRQPRPLLYAEGAVRDWLQYHPTNDGDGADPNAYLITGKPKWQKANPYEPVSAKTIQRTMRKLTENAFGVDSVKDFPKPTHPHMMRHNYVTWLKRELEEPDNRIIYLIGHAPDSTIMQTTYSHLSGEDHSSAARKSAGIEEEDEEEKRTAPPVCKCGAPQERPQAVACWNCGMQFSPAAWEKQKEEEERAEKAVVEVDNETEAKILMRVRDDMRENPEEYIG